MADADTIMTENYYFDYQDEILKQRLYDVKQKKVEGKSEAELDAYLKKRGAI